MPRPSDILPTNAEWRRHGLFGKFRGEAEPAFRRIYAEELVQRAKLSSMAAALVMLAYSFWDFLVLPSEIVPTFLWVRSAFVTGPMLFVWWLCHQPSAARHLQAASAVSAIAAGLAIIALVCIARVNGTPIEYEGVILTLFYFYCCGGLRVRTATAAGLVVLIVYPIAEHYAGLDDQQVTVRAMFLLSANIVGFISAALMEQSSRRNFMLAVQLNNLASRDHLTGLFNRRALRSILDRIWREAAAKQQPVTVAMIDVDWFKQYNDEYGHSEGDEALRSIAVVLEQHVQSPLDVAARFGGEEFVCVWSGRDMPTMRDHLALLRNDIRKLERPHAHSPLGRLSLSFGIAHVYPHRGVSVKDALKDADRLLYEAKAGGRNRAVFAPAGSEVAGAAVSSDRQSAKLVAEDVTPPTT